MPSDALQYFRDLYAAFNSRHIDAVLEMMSEDVDWPNAWKGGRLRGRAAVREYWSAQFAEIDPRVEPLDVEVRADGALAVMVHQIVRSLDGELLDEGDLLHVYRLRDDSITRMDVEELGA